jgi:glycosyltransferase involved in cell wall biosynthesis
VAVGLFSNTDGVVTNLLISRVTTIWFFFWDRWSLWRGSQDEKRHPAGFGDKVSVIIPTFNRVELLFSRALPTVLCQTYSNIEVLVVSHGCSDGTPEKVKALSLQDSRVRLIEIDRKSLGYPNRAEYHWLVGPVRPWNAGLRAATGNWIARIDDDDEWLPNHLETLLKLAVQKQLDFVSSSYEVIDGRGNQIFKPEGIPAIGGVQTWVYRAKLKKSYVNINCWRKSWNRNNDTDLQARFARLNIKFGATNLVTVQIRPRPGDTEVGSVAYLQNPLKIERRYGIAGNKN